MLRRGTPGMAVASSIRLTTWSTHLAGAGHVRVVVLRTLTRLPVRQ